MKIDPLDLTKFVMLQQAVKSCPDLCTHFKLINEMRRHYKQFVGKKFLTQ